VSLDPRTPVLVGVGQVTQRVDQGAASLEPVDLMAEAARQAEADAGAALLGAVDTVAYVAPLSWPYRDPARLVAEKVGAGGARTVLTTPGGNSPQALLHWAADEVVAGRADLVVLGGAEAWRSARLLRKAGQETGWAAQGEDVAPDVGVGADLDMIGPAEAAIGLGLPIQVYPMFDVALRAAEGWSVAEHRARIGALYARFSAVAAANPYAWNRTTYTADEVIVPTAENRLVGAPYTKRVNSYEMVDQGAALVLCSVARAEALGVDRDRWVFPHSGAEAKEPYVSVRPTLASSPSMAVAGGAALDLAGTDIDGVAHLDLYSCFPSAVLQAARALGVDDERPLTVTGGMSFFGGPWNDYVSHSIATMVEVLRAHPGDLGLVSGNGGLTSKQAYGVYGTKPPAAGWRWSRPQAEVDAAGTIPVHQDHDGPVTLETYTVMHDRDGTPVAAFAATRTPDGGRAWGTTDDADVCATLLEDTEHVGDPAHRAADGRLSL